jgi:epsilon-lactone hydrolase
MFLRSMVTSAKDILPPKSRVALSDFVRLYQALDHANIPVKLDIYEGMPHVHQFLYKTPESKIALSKMNDFLQANLNK